ncbi:MAG: hypothetical protein GX220_03785 [Treponema sp.]|jgi:hypothetical protein|nr:hypothetical protein [Treponema sp.]
MQTTILIVISVVNIVLWIILFRTIRKKITNGYIDQFSIEIENLVKELDRTTENNLSLLEEKIQQVKDVLVYAENKIEIAKNDMYSAPRSQGKHLVNKYFQNSSEEQMQIKIIDETENVEEKKEIENKETKSTMQQRVLELYKMELSLESIADRLNISITEVEMIVLMYGDR